MDQLRTLLVWSVATGSLLIAGDLYAQDWRCRLAAHEATCEGSRATNVDRQLEGTPLRRFTQVLSIAPDLIGAGVKPCEVVAATLEPRADKLSIGHEHNLIGAADTKFGGPYVMFAVTLQCIVDRPISLSQSAKRRTRENASHSFGIDCRNQESHYFAQGRDYYSDGTSSHWDSQGSALVSPWRGVRSDGAAQYVFTARAKRVFDAICLTAGSQR